MATFEPRRAKEGQTITFTASGGARRTMKATEGETGWVFNPQNEDDNAAADLFGLSVARKEQAATKPSKEKE